MAGLATKFIAGINLLRSKFFRNYTPIEINIHITDRCNLKCSYCYSNFYKRKLPDISLANCQRIISAFKQLGVIEVSLIGGEPFLHPQFAEIVDYVKSQGLMCSTITNGYYLSRYFDSLKKLDMVCVSIDGPEEINDLTRGKGSYQHAIKALELLVANKVNRSIRSTLQKYNLEYIDDMLSLAVKYNALLNFGLLFPQSDESFHNKTVSKDTPEDNAYKKVLKYIIELKKKYPTRFFNSVTNFRNAYHWPVSYTRFFLDKTESKKYPQFKPIRCYGGRTFATVDTDGKIYPCTNLIGYYPAPNVLEEDVIQAWHKLGNHTCTACFYLSSVEKNLVSDLNIDALWNIINVKRLG